MLKDYANYDVEWKSKVPNAQNFMSVYVGGVGRCGVQSNNTNGGPLLSASYPLLLWCMGTPGQAQRQLLPIPTIPKRSALGHPSGLGVHTKVDGPFLGGWTLERVLQRCCMALESVWVGSSGVPCILSVVWKRLTDSSVHFSMDSLPHGEEHRERLEGGPSKTRGPVLELPESKSYPVKIKHYLCKG